MCTNPSTSCCITANISFAFENPFTGAFSGKALFCLKADSGSVFQRGFGLLFSCGLSFFAGAIPLRSLRGLAQSMVPTGSIKSRSKLNRAKNGFCARFTRTSCSCLRSGISPLFPHERWRQMQPGFPKLMTAIHDAQSALVSSHKKGRPIRSRTAFLAGFPNEIGKFPRRPLRTVPNQKLSPVRKSFS